VLFFPIEVGNSRLKNRCKQYPQEIGDQDICYERIILVNTDHSPQKSHVNNKNINKCGFIIFQSELNRCIGKIAYQIYDKRQDEKKWQCSAYPLKHHIPKGEKNHDVEDAPNRCKNPGWWGK